MIDIIRVVTRFHADKYVEEAGTVGMCDESPSSRSTEAVIEALGINITIYTTAEC